MPFVTVRSRWSHSEALHTSPATQTEILHWHTLHGMWLCGRSLASYIGRCNKAALVGGGGAGHVGSHTAGLLYLSGPGGHIVRLFTPLRFSALACPPWDSALWQVSSELHRRLDSYIGRCSTAGSRGVRGWG